MLVDTSPLIIVSALLTLVQPKTELCCVKQIFGLQVGRKLHLQTIVIEPGATDAVLNLPPTCKPPEQRVGFKLKVHDATATVEILDENRVRIVRGGGAGAGGAGGAPPALTAPALVHVHVYCSAHGTRRLLLPQSTTDATTTATSKTSTDPDAAT